MTLPSIGLAVAASLLATALLGATAGLAVLRRIQRLARAQEDAELRVARLAFEVRRLEQLIAGSDRIRSVASSATLAAPPPPPLISVPDLGREAAPADEGLAEKHGEVWALVEEGRTPREIARQTGRPIGQVELVAGLYRQHLAARNRGRHQDA